MPNFTTNLNLEKPLGTEYYDIEVHNENSDKIDTFAGEVLKKTGDTADDLAVIAPPIDDLDVARKQELNSMAGADIRGYIEDGTPHAVGEVWLSKNTPGEFKCLIANSDNYPDLTPTAPKWLQIDDLTNASKLENLLATSQNSYGGNSSGITYNIQVEKKGENVILSGTMSGTLTVTDVILFALPVEYIPVFNITNAIYGVDTSDAVLLITKTGSVVIAALSGVTIPTIGQTGVAYFTNS